MTVGSATPLTSADLRVLLAQHRPPCISIYEPTHRSFPSSSEEDPVRYRNLLRQAESSLRRRYPAREFRPVLEKLERFATDDDFWIHSAAALAVFGSPDELRVFKLSEPVPEMLSVADSFHIKPLIRVLQREERYQVLALTLSRAKLFEGTRDSLHPIDLSGIPATLEDALGTEITEPFLKVTRSYGAGAAGAAPMFHGQGDRKDERNLDRERFFRIIDRQIQEHFSNRTKLPLVLVAVAENQGHFRALSHNPSLLPRGVELDPGALSLESLHELVWEQVLRPYFEERLQTTLSDYREARAHGRGSDRPEEIAEALAQGRVGTLLVEENRTIPGRVDAVAGRVAYAESAETADVDPGAGEPSTDDILDDLAEAVLRTRGTVLVVPAEKMPTQTGVAAIYRF
jgi:hypothetical protein